MGWRIKAFFKGWRYKYCLYHVHFHHDWSFCAMFLDNVHPVWVQEHLFKYQLSTVVEKDKERESECVWERRKRKWEWEEERGEVGEREEWRTVQWSGQTVLLNMLLAAMSVSHINTHTELRGCMNQLALRKTAQSNKWTLPLCSVVKSSSSLSNLQRSQKLPADITWR